MGKNIMYKSPAFLKTLLLTAFLLVLSNQSIADSNTDLIEALVNKGILTAEEAAPLLERVEMEAKEKVKMAEAEEKPSATVDVGTKGIVVTSADGSASMQVGGRLHADVYSHSGDGDLAGGVQAADGTELRRARMYLKGKINNDFKYMIEADFAGDRASLRDVFVTYTGFKGPWELTFGNQKHAHSMEIQESSNDIMFTERSMVTALTAPFFDRAIGLNLKTKGDNWNVQGGIYGDNVSSGSSNIDEGNGFGIRGTYAPIMEKDRVFHIGASYGNRSTSDDNNVNGRTPRLSYETTNASSLRLLNTGTISDMDGIQTTILELAAMSGPFSFQAEIAESTVDRTANPDLDFSGFYAQVGYTLTGESRTYKGSDGEFKRLKPANSFDLQNGTWGAWELAARYDEVDLNDGAINGGDGTRFTLALNWYLNDNIRIMADYARIFDLSNGPIVNNDGSDADDIDAVTIRTNWAF